MSRLRKLWFGCALSALLVTSVFGADGNAESSSGLGVDKSGGPVVDPSKNVLDLVRAETHRSDDLRQAEARRVDEKMAAEARRTDDLRTAESRRVDETLKLIALYEDRLATAEKLRIDAIRAVDVNAVAVASQRAADQALVLAKQVTDSAEALRSLVASTAQTVAASQQQLAATLTARITTLEQAQYEGKGRSGVIDPTMVELKEQVSALVKMQAAGGGKSEGFSQSWVILVGAAGVIIALWSFRRERPKSEKVTA